MIRVPVEQLAEGQVLAQDVTRSDGVVLMGKGKAITPEVLSLLRRLEIEAVVVEGDLFASDEERAAFLAGQEAALVRRFSRVEADPLQRAIRELFRRRIAGGCHPRAAAGRDGE
ncbi:MAG: hypothetical protein ACOZHQ_02260 [Thermodesulfobacteriota bacterium]